MSNKFKPIPDHIKYEISDKGDVRLRDYTAVYADGSTAIMKGERVRQFMCNGMWRVRLDGKDYLVHRLVAQAFIPNPHEYMYVRHVDGDVNNNSKSNLEWTNGGNRRYGQYKYLYGTAPGTKIKCINDGNVFRSILQASRYYNLNYTRLCYGIQQRKPVNNYVFKYTSESPNVFIDH